MDGRTEHHPEGHYGLDWREDGKRRRAGVGKDAGKARQEQERHQVFLQARFIGLAVAAENPHGASPTVQEACDEFLAEIRLQRSPKTFQQYRTALAYFQESSGHRQLSQVDRRLLLEFHKFLAEQKKLASRTIWTKTMIVVQMLKANGVTGLSRRGDGPRYAERVPKAYAPEQLQRFFAACDEPNMLLFRFFLGSGFREKEVQFLIWGDLSFEEQVARVTAKPNYGFACATRSNTTCAP